MVLWCCGFCKKVVSGFMYAVNISKILLSVQVNVPCCHATGVNFMSRIRITRQKNIQVKFRLKLVSAAYFGNRNELFA